MSTTHWTVSHGMSGYLPMSDDAFAFLSWEAAREAYVADMRDYADTDDDGAWEDLTCSGADGDYPRDETGEVDYGDDTPSMLATVDSMIRDGDVAPFPGQSWTVQVEDSSGRWIYFALDSHEATECEDSCEVIDADD